MEDKRVKTLKTFLEEIASYSYDNGDWEVIKNTKKEKEVEEFVTSYIAGCEIVQNGKDGKNVVIKGSTDKNYHTTGNEELFCHDYLVYDLTGHTGQWVALTFQTIEEVEKHIISAGGYLNVYCTEMIVMENGVIKPFEVLFRGNEQKDIVLDKDRIDETFDVAAMKERLSVNWK